MVVDSCQADAVPEREKFGRMKLLQFCENHRPAYWGTWNRRSSLIQARNPWAKDAVSTPDLPCSALSAPLAFLSPSVGLGLLLCSPVKAEIVGISCRSCWTMRLTVMRSGKRRSQGKVSPIVKR